MNITSAVFMRGVKGDNEILEDGTPQIAFVGRSNVGKSSLIGSLVNSKKLTRVSKTPGRTQEMNVFLINETHYFIDLPGYGFAKVKMKLLDKLSKSLAWYLFHSQHDPKVVVVIDAQIGPTDDDIEMLEELERVGRNVIIVLNKVDKIKKSSYKYHLEKLAERLPGYKLFPYSSKTRVGAEELIDELLN